MKNKDETLSGLMRQFEYQYDLRTAFDDFLTLSVCAFGQNPAEGRSYDEELYMQTIRKYKDSELRHNFPKLVASLVTEMEARLESSEGFDVLWEFYESGLSRKGASQFFTPWTDLQVHGPGNRRSGGRRHQGPREASADTGPFLRKRQDPSGRVQGKRPVLRILRSGHRRDLRQDVRYNLFLSGLFRAETICADALLPEDVRTGYRSSFLPFGLFRIKDKEQSRLWHMLKNSWDRKPSEAKGYDGDPARAAQGNQLRLF